MASSGIWDLLKHLKFESIFFKNYIIIMLLIVIPLVGIIWGVYSYSYNLMIEEISTFCLGELKSKRDAFELLANDIGLSSIALSLNKKVQLFLINDKRDLFNYNPYELREILNILELSNEYLKSIYLYRDSDDYIMTYSRESGFISGFLDISWFEVYQERTEKLITGPWVISRRAVDPYQNYHNVISIINPVYIVNDFSSGAIIFNLSINKIKEIIMSNQNIAGSQNYIINNAGEVIFSTNFSLMSKNINDVNVFNLIDQKINSSPKLITINEEKYILSVVESELFNWTYISVSPLKFFQDRITSLRNFIRLIIFISLFVVIIVAGLISYKAYRPVHHLISYVDHPEEWKKNKAKLPGQLPNLLLKIKRYITTSTFQDKLFQKLTILKKSQLTALQSHINPHFLFNTLDTVKWLAMELTQGNNKVSKIVAALAKLLREEIDIEQSLIPLEKEVDYLKLYLYIQGFRYKNKFKIKWDIGKELLNCKIIKISLQPLVENSIYHGIKPKGNPGIIKIKARKNNNFLIIKIIDNGVGISSGHLKELNKILKDDYYDHEDHLGLKNVNQRIKIIFGDDYGVYLYSKKGKGTVIKMKLPVID